MCFFPSFQTSFLSTATDTAEQKGDTDVSGKDDQLKRQVEMSRHTDEDYLKHIFQVRLRKGTVKIKDLSEAIGRNDSSVRAAVAKLTERGYVRENEGRGGNVELTEEGRRIAEQILQRHRMIQDWMIRLGISAEEADRQACQMEHVISDRVISAIQRHVELAVSLLGGDSAYPDKMKALAEDMHRRNPVKTPAAEVDMPEGGSADADEVKMMPEKELIGFLERFGGMEQISETLEFAERQGGMSVLQEMKEFVDILGGIGEIRRARSFIIQKRSEKRLADAVKLLSEEGDPDALRLASEQIGQLGGASKVRRILNLAEKVGGMDILLELTEETLKLKNIFEKTNR